MNVRFEIGNTFVHDPKNLSVHYFGVLEYFLCGLGDEGRFAIKQLVVKDTSVPMDASISAHGAFNRVLGYLRDCVSLEVLELQLSVQLLFRNAPDALEDFLLRGKPLQSDALTSFNRLIKAMPRLRTVLISRK